MPATVYVGIDVHSRQHVAAVVPLSTMELEGAAWKKKGAALKKGWAGLYITLVGGERPVLKLSLGPPCAVYTPKGYRPSFARLLLPEKLRLPAPSGSRPEQGELVLQ